jgi:scyllo-inositol 2-dehydrogenase (NADP+)
MGLSHQSIANAHPDVRLTSVSDASGYILEMVSTYTNVKGYASHSEMLARESLDCVFVATPSRYHAEIVGAALQRGLHVFCEKPFALDPGRGFQLAQLAEEKQLVNQVGYHCRFIATFNEAKRVLERKLIGELHQVRAEVYGPVVLRPKGATWRSQKTEGGGCLYDYACHAIDLLNYLIGRPTAVSGTILKSVFSRDVDDEVFSTFHFAGGVGGQLAANWSDDSHRKMSVKLSLWGTNGRINVDRQEIQVYVRKHTALTEDYQEGWNVRYTTDLTPPVWFYVRGEEYSAQIDHFVECIKTGATPISTFRTASDTSLVAAMMRADAQAQHTLIETPRITPLAQPARGWLRTMSGWIAGSGQERQRS